MTVNQATVFINFRTVFKFYFKKGKKKVNLNILKTLNCHVHVYNKRQSHSFIFLW